MIESLLQVVNEGPNFTINSDRVGDQPSIKKYFEVAAFKNSITKDPTPSWIKIEYNIGTWHFSDCEEEITFDVSLLIEDESWSVCQKTRVLLYLTCRSRDPESGYSEFDEEELTTVDIFNPKFIEAIELFTSKPFIDKIAEYVADAVRGEDEICHLADINISAIKSFVLETLESGYKTCQT